MKLITLLFTLIIVISCSTDYSGNEPVSENPTLTISEPGTNLVNSFVRVEWFGVIGAETDMDYFYCVTTDTTITPQTALSSLAEDKWVITKNNYADISFPMVKFNSSVVFYRDSVYQDQDTNQVSVKLAFSKIFVYAQNSSGTRSPVSGKLYSRINQKPKLTIIYSKELVFNSGDETIDIYEDKMILPESNPYSTPVDFNWWGEDPDTGSKIQFKWELWENVSKGSVLVKASEWGEIYSVELNDDIYYHNSHGDYSFKVFIRDDALEPGESHFTVNFSVFTPTFDKGILLLDDTDPTLYPPSTLYNGNPDDTLVKAFYEDLLKFAGYKPEGEATDSLSLYRIKRFVKGAEMIGWEYTYWDDDENPATPDVITDSIPIYSGVYKPNLEELSKYRLVIIASDDRSNTYGVDFQGEPPFTGYDKCMSRYLDVGGKTFLLGPSVFMGKFYVAPDQIPINWYAEPYNYIFEGNTVVSQGFGARTEEFFRDYFGIYSMTFPEQKTFYTMITGTNTNQYCIDHYLSDNYDFIGINKYDNITDLTDINIRIDSVKVNDYWKNIPGTGGRIRLNALKDNGTVFTGVPSFEVFKGEAVYKYQSIYDLPITDSLSNDNVYTGITHYLWCKNKVTGTIVQPVLKRSGTIATRYIADNDRYRTAFFGLPTFFLDNSSNQMSDMFKAMIDWFNLEKDPLEGFKNNL